MSQPKMSQPIAINHNRIFLIFRLSAESPGPDSAVHSGIPRREAFRAFRSGKRSFVEYILI